MNRPNRRDEKYFACPMNEHYDENYTEDLEKYCDHLESVIEQKNDLIASSYIELNKALDRACDQLQHMILGTKPVIQYTPEQWKEILLNDKLWEDTEKYE